MISYDEMKRADCLICSILCEGLEQYSKDQDSFTTGIPLKVQEGIVQLHISGEHSGYLEFFTKAGMRFFLILKSSGINAHEEKT